MFEKMVYVAPIDIMSSFDLRQRLRVKIIVIEVACLVVG